MLRHGIRCLVDASQIPWTAHSAQHTQPAASGVRLRHGMDYCTSNSLDGRKEPTLVLSAVVYCVYCLGLEAHKDALAAIIE
jgi:hypothetical protein